MDKLITIIHSIYILKRLSYHIRLNITNLLIILIKGLKAQLCGIMNRRH